MMALGQNGHSSVAVQRDATIESGKDRSCLPVRPLQRFLSAVAVEPPTAQTVQEQQPFTAVPPDLEEAIDYAVRQAVEYQLLSVHQRVEALVQEFQKEFARPRTAPALSREVLNAVETIVDTKLHGLAALSGDVHELMAEDLKTIRKELDEVRGHHADPGATREVCTPRKATAVTKASTSHGHGIHSGQQSWDTKQQIIKEDLRSLRKELSDVGSALSSPSRGREASETGGGQAQERLKSRSMPPPEAPTAMWPRLCAESSDASTSVGPERLRIIWPGGVTLRSGCEVTSDLAGSQPLGAVLEVLERRRDTRGVMRLRTAMGWLSEHNQDGSLLLEPEAVASRQTSRSTTISSAPRAVADTTMADRCQRSTLEASPIRSTLTTRRPLQHPSPRSSVPSFSPGKESSESSHWDVPDDVPMPEAAKEPDRRLNVVAVAPRMVNADDRRRVLV